MQYQQAMEYMKRRMDIFEMTLVSKQTHAEPAEVSGYDWPIELFPELVDIPFAYLGSRPEQLIP